MSRRLYIAAKAPRAGLAKTRLASEIGNVPALELYRAFLRDLAHRFTNTDGPLGWFVTPEDAWADLAPLVCRAGDRASVIVQGPGDWTARQRALFRDAERRGEERTVLIASDSPHLEAGLVASAFAALDHAEVVLGPTGDGGYYLLGMRGWHDVLAGVPMSTHDVAAGVLARARLLGARVALLAPTFDIDRLADLPQLESLAASRSDLVATGRALAALMVAAQ